MVFLVSSWDRLDEGLRLWFKVRFLDTTELSVSENTSAGIIMSWLREPNTEPIPGYRLIEPLGSGGFGEVWKCEAPGGLFKAIKFVYGNLNSLDVDCVRAEQEQRAMQRIKEVRHPFVCSLDLIRVINGELVIVMELAERTIHDLFIECQATGLIGIPRADLLRYLGDAAEALDFMNDEPHRLQHLDVKPKNLFIISNHCKVADFGLVKHLERQTSSGLMGGVTPLYAAPETFNGKISENTDQYSLAIVYQELLTGHRPFNGKNVRQLAQQHMLEEPDLRSLPEAERPIVARALAKDPTKRFSSCTAFYKAVYKARSHGRPVELPVKGPVKELKDLVVARPSKGDKSKESLRDFQLDEIADSSQSFDFGAPPPPPRDLAGESNIQSEMGVTIAQPDTGALRPTLVIGLGAFGRKALLELRCRFLDRFGDLGKIPLLRFLCIDPDPEAVNTAIRGAPEVALNRNEVYPLPLQPVVNYRRRSLEELSEWLPREKLYAMPRSLQTQGSRALGRLAFSDNQQRLVARIRREIQEVSNPDNIYQSVTHTGLALRDATPRVYVIGSAGGGSSGLLPDLGYAVRRVLAQLRHPDGRAAAFLLCGAPQDPATQKQEQANIYATLTELNHFCDPNIRFAAQYGVDGQRIVDEDSPFTSVYLLPQQHRTPDAMDATVKHLGNYLFHELTTPLGLRLDNLRHGGGIKQGEGLPAGQMAAPLRSFGTYAVWFPRGLLMRLAARQACQRVIESWLATAKGEISAQAQQQTQAFMDKVLHHDSLKPDLLALRIETMAQAGSPTDTGNTPGEILAGILAKLEEQIVQPVAQEDAGNWAKQALGRVKDWVGSGEGEQALNDWRKTRLTRALGNAAQKVADEWDQELFKDLAALMEHPGARVVTAEVALDTLQAYFHDKSDSQKEGIAQQAAKTAEAWKQVELALLECQVGGGGFRIFGGRTRSRQLRVFMDQLAFFARQRLAEEILGAVRHCFALLASKMAERSRDMGFVRQRLRHLQESLEVGPADTEEEVSSTRPGTDFTLTRTPLPSTESFWEAIRQSATARVVLPNGESDLERAALRFLQGLHPDQWVILDKELHERILVPRGGLHGACMTSGDLSRNVAIPLLIEAGTILGQHLPIMDVAQILINEAGGSEADQVNGDLAATELTAQVRDYLERAAPLQAAGEESHQHAFLLVPASPAGKALENAIHKGFPEIRHVRVAGQSDLMLCREQGQLTAQDLQKLLKPCQAAYENLAGAPNTSPHARFDILDWLPLDP